jgi:hypothetical protein
MAAPTTFSLYTPSEQSYFAYPSSPTQKDMFLGPKILTCASSGISFPFFILVYFCSYKDFSSVFGFPPCQVSRSSDLVGCVFWSGLFWLAWMM